MQGGIYSEEKCPQCGQGMRDNGRTAVCCPVHKKETAHNLIVRFGRKIFKRFTDYDQASRFLTGLRFKTDEGTFDARDYQRSNPLSFSHLAAKYLEIKEQTISPGSYRAVCSHIRRCEDFFGTMNVKEIGYGEIEDFLLSQKDVSSKTVHNIKTTLHNFFVWLRKRRILRPEQLPEFPDLSYELEYRKTIDKSVQDAILDEIREQCTPDNPRAYIAIRWLCTYVSLRPGDLEMILEEDIDLAQGVVMIRHHKTSKTTHKIKCIPLLDEDVEVVKALVPGFPKMPFFRWEKGGHGKVAGQSYGQNYLYKLWKRACSARGVEGVDLYGGTRHSSMQDLMRKKGLSPEEVKRLSLHTTNKALDRYLEIDVEELREGYSKTRTENNSLIHQSNTVLPIRKT